MTEDELRRGLESLSARMPVSNLADDVVARGRRLQLRRTVAQITVAVVTIAAAISVPLAVLATPNRTQKAPATPSTPRSESTGAGFEVGDPPLTVIGGVPAQNPTCQPDQVTGNATFERTADGVGAVVDLSSAARCNLLLGKAGPRLLAANGTRLPVKVVPNPDKANPATYDPDWIMGPRRSLGFAWDGSWCGTAPHSIRIALKGGTVTVPATGPTPSCGQTSDSRIIVGSQDFRHGPVQPAPPEWRFLTASLSAPASLSDPEIRGMTVTLTNTSVNGVPLNPRPRFCIGVRDKYGDGTQCEALRHLYRGAENQYVPANGALTLQLPAQSISQDWPNLRGSAIYLTFTMTGVPNSTVTTNKAN